MDVCAQQADKEAGELARRFADAMTGEGLFRRSDISLDDVARYLGVNRNYLSHAVNRVLGQTFIEYINMLRVEESLRIMRGDEGDRLSVEEIAHMAGFGNRKTFFRVFKKAVGCSASQYRQTIKIPSL